MAEDTTTTTETQDPPERTVPYSRFKEVNDKLAEAKREQAEYQDRLEALENRDKTDVERLTRDLEKAQKRQQEAETRAADLEAKSARDAKASLVSNAASKLNFHDPQLAAQLVDLEDIDDAGAAEKAVKALAKERAYLVRSDSPETAKLRKIGVDGQVIDDAKDAGLVTEEQQRRMWGEELANIALGANTGGGTFPSGQ